MHRERTDQPVDPKSFAGLLAKFTATDTDDNAQPISSSGSWTDNLEEDVAHLSYEHALRNHARRQADQTNITRHAQPASEEGRSDKKRTLKTASVTLRMSHAEFLRLRQRAAEANLSVSAYVRSCAFEVDELRSEVKRALAGLRNPPPLAPIPSESKLPGWLRMLRPGKGGVSMTHSA